MVTKSKLKVKEMTKGVLTLMMRHNIQFKDTRTNIVVTAIYPSQFNFPDLILDTDTH